MSPGADSYNLTKKITTHSAVDFIFLYSVTIQERLKYIIDMAVYSCSEDRVPTLIPRESRDKREFPETSPEVVLFSSCWDKNSLKNNLRYK